jgi:hypothetical protein
MGKEKGLKPGQKTLASGQYLQRGPHRRKG